MIDKDSEIQRLTNLTKFLKSKLDECLKGNITSDPIVNKVIAKHINDITRVWLTLAKLWQIIINHLRNG